MFGFCQRLGHELRMKSRYGGEHGFWRGHGRQARARPEGRESRHRRRARFAERSADYQHVSVAALVGDTRAGGEQGSEVGRGTEVESKLRDDGFGRRTDGRNHSGTTRERSENMRGTRSGEGHDGIGTGLVAYDITRTGRGRRLHGIGIGARRNVDGSDGSGRRIHLHPSDRGRVERADRRTKTGAEDGIHNHVGGKNLRRIGRIEPARLAHDEGRDVHGMEGFHHVLKHDRRISPKLPTVADSNRTHGAARSDECAGHGESIAAVVAFAAENADALGMRVIGEDKTRDGRAGVFHQGEGRYSEALRGDAIDLAHFRRAHDLHTCDPDDRDPEGSAPAVSSSSRSCCGSPMAIRKSPASMRSSGAGLKRMPASRLMARTMTPRSWRMRDFSMVLPANGLRGVIAISPISRSMPRWVVAASRKLTTCGRRKEWAIRCPAKT